MSEPTKSEYRTSLRMLEKAGVVRTESQRAEDRKKPATKEDLARQKRLANKMFGPAYDPKDQDEIDEKAAERRRRWPVGPSVTEK